MSQVSFASFTHTPGRKISQASPPTATSWPAAFATVYAYLAHSCTAAFSGCRPEFCARLGVSLDALIGLSVGIYLAKPPKNHRGVRIPELDAAAVDFLSLPVRNARDVVVGVLFISVDGTQWFLCGSHGLISPSDWDRFSNSWIVTRPPLDVLGVMTFGVGAVAVTDPDAATQELIDKLKMRDQWLRTRKQGIEITVVDNGLWGHQICQAILANQMPSSRWACVPDRFPTLHSFVQYLLSDFEVMQGWLGIDSRFASEVLPQIGDRLLSRLEISSVAPTDGNKPRDDEPAQQVTSPLSGPVVDALLLPQSTSHERALAEEARQKEQWDRDNESARQEVQREREDQDD